MISLSRWQSNLSLTLSFELVRYNTVDVETRAFSDYSFVLPNDAFLLYVHTDLINE